MARLTKYDSFEALKLDSASNEPSLMDSDERHLAFEKFITLLQKQITREEQDNNSDKPGKKRD